MLKLQLSKGQLQSAAGYFNVLLMHTCILVSAPQIKHGGFTRGVVQWRTQPTMVDKQASGIYTLVLHCIATLFSRNNCATMVPILLGILAVLNTVIAFHCGFSSNSYSMLL